GKGSVKSSLDAAAKKIDQLAAQK
ncbi:MAG: hypothetical protein JWO01_2691, partial [Microbacteriaceae bacterium]|nr:hypothetical protein [Microbacteriaceae bacterium]